MKHWFVFYTKSRQEKKVHDLLVRNGFEVFLPIQKVMRQWSDRKKKVEVPLFNSYIFVCDTEDRIPLILQTPGMAWNIRYNGKPARLREEELSLIQRFLESGYFLETSGYDQIPVGTAVKVLDGPLKGAEGLVTAENKEGTLVVLLESIGQSIRVQLEPQWLKPI